MNEQANILRGCDATVCSRTFRSEHGGALPGGPFPGTHGDEGDVRRCEHGKVWIFVDNPMPYKIDVWRRVSRFWEPRQYRRASTALDASATGLATPDDIGVTRKR